MELNIDPNWLLQKAEKENNKIISVGGLVSKIAEMETKRSTEILTHYSCPICDQWWTIGDSPYKPGGIIYCPNGHPSIISEHDSCNDKLEPMR